MLALTTLACAADPLRITYEDVVDFWMMLVESGEPDYPHYHLYERPYYVVDCYDHASSRSFEHEIPAKLRAGIVLEDGATVRLELWVSGPKTAYWCTSIYAAKSPNPWG